MPSELRVAYHRQLEDIDRSVIRLLASVTDGVAAATDAFLSSDDSARAVVKAREAEVNTLHQDLEELIASVLALQAPVASELRFLVSALRLVPELERCHDLVDHIAARAARRVADELSPRARGLVAELGRQTSAMWKQAADAYIERDAEAAARLPTEDEVVDALRARLADELGSGSVAIPVAMEGILIGRFYERLGDHAVHVARQVTYLAGSA